MSKICVAGGHGLVGTALVRRLMTGGYEFFTTADEFIDLRNYNAFTELLEVKKPDCVILVAAKHGGISEYNAQPAEYFKDNILICTSVISAAFDSGIKKLINIGASCVYSDNPKGIYGEEDYDKQAVQKSTEPYGLAKLSGMKLCEYYNSEYGTDFISLLPVNLYGDGIGYKIDYSSVIPAMIDRFHKAKINKKKYVEIWGNGKNTREFLYVEDFVDAIETIIRIDKFTSHMFNVGGYENITINALAQTVADVIGYHGEIRNDFSKPSGSSRGTLNATRITELGWKPKTSMKEGISLFYNNYLRQEE